MQLTQTLSAISPIQAIPKERLMAKVFRSVFGLVFIAGAALAAWKLAWPWYVDVPLAMFGAHVISTELTKTGLNLIVGLVKDLLAAVKGK